MDSEIILPPDYKPSADEEYFVRSFSAGKNLFWNSPRIRWKICARAA